MADFTWPNLPADGTFFQPRERWRSPMGVHYIVEWSSRIERKAGLRRLQGPPGSGLHNETTGRLRYVPWDGVQGWTRTREATDA